MSLDDVLAAWAAGVRLDEAEAAAMYERVIQTTAPSTLRPGREPVPGLDAAWWRRFTTECATWVVASNRPLGTRAVAGNQAPRWAA